MSVGELIGEILLSILAGLLVFAFLKSTPDFILSMLIDYGEKLITQIYYGLPPITNPEWAEINENNYTTIMGLFDLLRFALGAVPTFVGLRFLYR